MVSRNGARNPSNRFSEAFSPAAGLVDRSFPTVGISSSASNRGALVCVFRAAAAGARSGRRRTGWCRRFRGRLHSPPASPEGCGLFDLKRCRSALQN
jgi:hypothetical protein